jgi:hypothetical protein
MLGREHEADLEREALKRQRAAEVRGNPRARDRTQHGSPWQPVLQVPAAVRHAALRLRLIGATRCRNNQSISEYLTMRLPGEEKGAAITRCVLSLSVALVFAAIVGMFSAAAAPAADRPVLLNDVARVYSLGVGEVRCLLQAEWDTDHLRAIDVAQIPAICGRFGGVWALAGRLCPIAESRSSSSASGSSSPPCFRREGVRRGRNPIRLLVRRNVRRRARDTAI